MKFDVDDKNRCRLVCVKFRLNRCRFAVAVAKCLGGSLLGTQCSSSSTRQFTRCRQLTIQRHTHTHNPFNGPLSGSIRVSRYQKGKTNVDFTEARDSE